MKITALVILLSIWFLRVRVTNANYRRIIRGPPQPPRPPPSPMQYLKKWPPAPPHPPRPQSRPRPIPVPVPTNFKKPVGPPLPKRHAIPTRNTWPNAQLFKPASEKPFLSSPKMGAPEYDYHIQTNNIPTQTNTITQVGEKGPIHTIPAPNLSPADKPNNIGHVQPIQQVYQSLHIIPQQQQQQQSLYNLQHQQQQSLNAIQQYQQRQTLHNIQQHQQQQVQFQNSISQQQQPHTHTIVEIQKSHQYQVTEASEPLQHVKLRPVYYAPDPNPSEGFREINKLPVQSEQLNSLPHAEYLVAPQEETQSLTPQELYKLLNSYPQQQLLDTYGLPMVQQPQLQQHLIQRQQQLPSYHALAATSQVFQQNGAQSKPQYQQFNYDEQEQRNLQNNQISSKVTADYSVKPAEYEGVNDNPADALAQAEYVQHFFDTRDEHIADNNVEPDTEPQQRELPNDELPTAFFSTLPSRQAAEALASLQEAGKLNSGPQQKSIEGRKQTPMTIYVPDNYDEDREENNDGQRENRQDSSPDRSDYEDNSQESDNQDIQQQFEKSSTYGSRVKSKNE